MVGISQAESNNIKACALPSIHLPLTRAASVVVRGEAVDVLLRRLWEWQYLVQQEERAPPLRKEREIVRFWKGWWSDNPSGSRPNFFGRQHLTFDKGGKCDGAKQGIVRFWKVMRGEGVCDNNIKKRSQLAAVTAYLIYWFV